MTNALNDYSLSKLRQMHQAISGRLDTSMTKEELITAIGIRVGPPKAETPALPEVHIVKAYPRKVFTEQHFLEALKPLIDKGLRFSYTPPSWEISYMLGADSGHISMEPGKVALMAKKMMETSHK